MAINVRHLATLLGINLTAHGVVTSFADNAPLTDVTTVEKPLKLSTDSSYVLFDSFIYPTHYLITNLNNGGFSIPVNFVSDDPTINYYDVTLWVTAYAQAETYINDLPCVDDNPNKAAIIDYYTLYLLSTNNSNLIKERSRANQEKVVIDTGLTGTNNPWFNKADSLANHCLPKGEAERSYFSVGVRC